MKTTMFAQRSHLGWTGLMLVSACAAPASPDIVAPTVFHPTGRNPDIARRNVAVSIRFDHPVDTATLEQLAAAGGVPTRSVFGQPAVVGSVVSAQVPRDHLSALARLDGVVRVEAARPAVVLPPLDQTAVEVEAPRVWSPPPPQSENLGKGVVVADLEISIWDIFHPDFFRPDGGHWDWSDRDGDEKVGPGDAVDLDGDGVTEGLLSLLEGARDDRYSGTYDFFEPGYQPDVDWLYVDKDQNGQRDVGAAAGFSDATPALGEPIFVGDDVNGNGTIDPGERLVRLSTSKFKAAVIMDDDGQADTFLRGENLATFPVWEHTQSHGTAALGIVAGGWPGLRRYTGLAPAADLVGVYTMDFVAGLAVAQDLGAQVVLHEWNTPTGTGDGASNIEVAIDQAAQNGQVQVAPTGNLAGNQRCMELVVPRGQLAMATASIAASPVSLTHLYIRLTWRGDLSDLSLWVSGPDGSRFDLVGSYGTGSAAGLAFYNWGEVTSKGTASVLLLGMMADGSALPAIDLDLNINALAASVTVRGIVTDSAMGWSDGIVWLDHTTDAGTALTPSTADTVIAVGAHGGNHDLSTSNGGARGEHRPYSGQGPRLDGQMVVDITAPDDPFTLRGNPDGTPGYRAFSGTSGASPHVAGAAALLLSGSPGLGHDEIEILLKDAAWVDDFTGSVPNEAYGFGKLRLGPAALTEPLPLFGEPPQVSVQVPTECRVGVACGVQAVVNDPDSDVGQIWVAWDVGYDGEYEVDARPTLDLTVRPTQSGRLTIVAKAIDPAGQQGRGLATLDIQPADPEPPDHRGDCATVQPMGPFFWLLAGLAGLGRRWTRQRV